MLKHCSGERALNPLFKICIQVIFLLADHLENYATEQLDLSGANKSAEWNKVYTAHLSACFVTANVYKLYLK